MLIGVNPILTGDLLKVLSDMGHGDEIVIADGNFAAEGDSTRRPPIWVPSDNTVEVLGAILKFLPVDDSLGAVRYIVESVDEGEKDDEEPLPAAATLPAPFFGWAGMKIIQVEPLGRMDFHEVAKKAYAIVATVDPRHYFCYVVRKGALPDPTAERSST